MAERQTIEKMLFACLRSAVTNEPLDRSLCEALHDEHQKAVYRLAKKHDVAHLIAYVLQRERIPLTAEAQQTLHRVQMAAVYRMQLLLREQSRICETLENAGVPHVLLKGAVLRNYYPEPWMRTSCDIDLLTPAETLESTASLLHTELDYKIDKTLDHDVQIFAPNGTHLELHYTLCVNHPSHDALLKDAWKYTCPIAGKHAAKALDFEFHLCYILAHIAKHVLSGGCGVRPFLDLFVLRRADCYDEQRLLSFCEQSGLLIFYRACCRLCDVWFDNKPYTQDDRVFADYVLGAGVYGTVENYTNVSNVRKGSKLAFLASRLFPPKESIYTLYPGARRKKALLPLYYIRRLFRVFLPSRRKATVTQLKQTVNLTEQTSQELADLLSKLGL